MAILKFLVWLVILHVHVYGFGCEEWTLKSDNQNKIHTVEMWLYRHLLRVSWKGKITNDRILEELGVT